MRIVVIGGCGNFGARIVRSLATDSGIELLVAGRRERTLAHASARSVVLDVRSPDLPERLRRLTCELVIHCAGPFQGQGYHVARSSLEAGAHYLDLADGRQFVAGFSRQIDAIATRAGRMAITGASTLPALSSAVVEALAQGLAQLTSIAVVIAPGQRAPRWRVSSAIWAVPSRCGVRGDGSRCLAGWT